MANEEVKEVPRYRYLERAYIHDRLHEIGEEVSTHLRPGPHMEPLNDAAKAAYEKAKRGFVTDPLGPLMRLNEQGIEEARLRPEHIVALQALAKLMNLVPKAPGETDEILMDQAESLKPRVKRAQGDGQGPAGG